MARTNTKTAAPKVATHGGAPAYAHLKPLDQLRRSVMSCLLFEKNYYEDGEDAATRLEQHARAVTPQELAAVAIEAREVHNLRHVPLLLTAILADTGRAVPGLVKDTIDKVIRRADEVAEFVAIYWRKGKTPLSAQVKKGLAKAIGKFDEYQLAKYNRDSDVKLRDVLFLVHAKPKDDVQAALWKRLAENELATPDTWEVALSGGADKKETFTRLLSEGNLGYFALLRNLRNMMTAGVDTSLVAGAITARKNGADKILPFRYVAAARACPQLERVIDSALVASINEMPALEGKTVVLVDVSGSMDCSLSAKSDLNRMDAAATLAAIIPGDVRLFSFSNTVKEVPARKGMAGVDAIIKSQPHGGTALAEAVAHVNSKVPYDRLIVITDEQSTSFGRTPDPVPGKHAYMINVASYKNGIGYGKWTHIDGFSESTLKWIAAFEQSAKD